MFLAYVPCMDLEVFPLSDIFEHFLQFLFNEGVSKHFSTILGTPDYVVVAYPCGMGLLIQTSVHG